MGFGLGFANNDKLFPNYNGGCDLSSYVSSGKFDTNPMSKRRDGILKKFFILIFIFLLFNVFYILLLQSSYMDTKVAFQYPLSAHNFPEIVERFRHTGKIPRGFNIITRYSQVKFLASPTTLTENVEDFGLFIIVKTAIKNDEKRSVIRRSWGMKEYLSVSSSSIHGHNSKPSKLAFLVGLPAEGAQDIPENIQIEQKFHGDIIVADFFDNYYNNTYKSMLAMKWVVENIPSRFEYLLLVDDDIYLDLINLNFYLSALPKRSFLKYEHKSDIFEQHYRMSTAFSSSSNLTSGNTILNDGLILGHIWTHSEPERSSLFGETKWSVSLEEYPWDRYPPYAAGAGILFSREAVFKLWFASFFVRHFWVDDVYLGILAFKMGLIPVHNPHFHVRLVGRIETDNLDLSELILLHGFECPESMFNTWKSRDVLTINNYTIC